MKNLDFIDIGTKFDVVPLKTEPKNTYYSYVKDFNDAEILIDLPSKEDNYAIISVKDIIKISVTAKEAIYSFNTVVTRKQILPITGFWVKTPRTFDRIQRRKYLRVSVNLAMKVVMIDKDGDMLNVAIQIRDFSAGGVSFYTNENLALYTKIGKFFVNFSLPASGKIIKTRAELIFIRPMSTDAPELPSKIKYQYVSALEFVDLDEETVDELCKFCFQYQIDLKRKGLL